MKTPQEENNRRHLRCLDRALLRQAAVALDSYDPEQVRRGKRRNGGRSVNQSIRDSKRRRRERREAGYDADDSCDSDSNSNQSEDISPTWLSPSPVEGIFKNASCRKVGRNGKSNSSSGKMKCHIPNPIHPSIDVSLVRHFTSSQMEDPTYLRGKGGFGRIDGPMDDLERAEPLLQRQHHKYKDTGALFSSAEQILATMVFERQTSDGDIGPVRSVALEGGVSAESTESSAESMYEGRPSMIISGQQKNSGRKMKISLSSKNFTLCEALLFSERARILITADPPFRAVHSNAAFEKLIKTASRHKAMPPFSILRCTKHGTSENPPETNTHTDEHYKETSETEDMLKIVGSALAEAHVGAEYTCTIHPVETDGLAMSPLLLCGAMSHSRRASKPKDLQHSHYLVEITGRMESDMSSSPMVQLGISNTQLVEHKPRLLQSQTYQHNQFLPAQAIG